MGGMTTLAEHGIDAALDPLGRVRVRRVRVRVRVRVNPNPNPNPNPIR